MGRQRFIIGNFEVISKIASGSFATVYEAQYVTPSSTWKDIRLGDYVAVKLSDPGINKDVESAEILAASIVPINDGLMRIYGTDWDPNTGQLYTVCELLDGSDLFSTRFKESDVRTIMKTAVYAVKALHDRNIIHRDIKPDNFIRVNNTSPVVKLGDFGFIHQLKNGHPKHTAGSYRFMAPEQVYPVAIDYGMKISAEKRGKIVKGSKKADVWSLGITAVELLTGRDAYPSKYHPNYVGAIVKRNLNTPIDQLPIDSEGKNWLYGMLDEDPDERFTIQEACDHPWIQGNSTQYVNQTMTQPLPSVTAPPVSRDPIVRYKPAEPRVHKPASTFGKQTALQSRSSLPAAPVPPEPLKARLPVASRRPPITQRPTLNGARSMRSGSKVERASSRLYDDNIREPGLDHIRGPDLGHIREPDLRYVRGPDLGHIRDRVPDPGYGNVQVITNIVRRGKSRAQAQTITKTQTIRTQDHQEPVYGRRESRYDNGDRINRSRSHVASVHLPRRKGESRFDTGGARRNNGGYGDKDPFY